MTRSALAVLLLTGCSMGGVFSVRDIETRAFVLPPESDCFVVIGAIGTDGEPIQVAVEGGLIVDGVSCDEQVDAGGRTLVPAFIDSHVHLAYLPREADLTRSGVAGAVDLAAPMGFFDHAVDPLRIRRAGPMVTAIGGYPTRSWGADGYGLECDDAITCMALVDAVVAAGATLVKVPLGMAPELDDATLAAVIEHAHARGARVVVHALSDAAALRAGRAGADVLAHTPTERLGDESIAVWSGRAVISTLGAFGGSPTTVENLRRLREAGAQVFYGTDLGNTWTAAIDERELGLLAAAGLDAAAIVESATSAPAAFFGFEDLGSLEPGRAASFLLVDGDPSTDPSVLANPSMVVIDGVPRG